MSVMSKKKLRMPAGVRQVIASGLKMKSKELLDGVRRL